MGTQVFVQGTSEREEALKEIQKSDIYRVSANMAQLVEYNMVGNYKWVPTEKFPNRVYTNLPIEEARVLYKNLNSKGMVALRNWIDD